MSDNRSMMDELYASTLKDIKEGEIVKGSIVAVTNKEVVVDIGFKSEGFVDIEEFRGHDQLTVGQQIDRRAPPGPLRGGVAPGQGNACTGGLSELP